MKRWRFLLIITALMVSSCGHKNENSSNGAAGFMFRGQGFSEIGTTYVEDSIIHFRDYASGESIPLCNRMNCDHKALSLVEEIEGKEPCLAYYADCDSAVVYGKSLYVFHRQNGKVTLSKASLNGSAKKTIVAFDASFHPNYLGYISDGTMWLDAYEASDDLPDGYTSDYLFYIYVISLDREKVWRFSKEFTSNVKILYYDKECALVSDKDENGVGSLWKLNAKDGSVEQLCKEEAAQGVFAANQSGALFRKKFGESIGCVYYDFARKREEIISENCIYEEVFSDDERIYCTKRVYTDIENFISIDYLGCRYADGTWKEVQLPEEYAILSRSFVNNVFLFFKPANSLQIVPLERVIEGDFTPVYEGDYDMYEPNK